LQRIAIQRDFHIQQTILVSAKGMKQALFSRPTDKLVQFVKGMHSADDSAGQLPVSLQSF
jgi:hypothetical protein